MSTKPDHHSVIVSISSDIGCALGRRWADRGFRISGTYRTESEDLGSLTRAGVSLVECDLANPAGPKQAAEQIVSGQPLWDSLVMCPATQDPVGAFTACDIDEWSHSITTNFTAQMELLHRLLPHRRLGTTLGPCVIFFAGGGTNNAPVNYSAYIVSKIASVKMCELLHAEIPDTRFVILGPGWVKTKIHESTIEAGPERAGSNFQRTIETLDSDRCTPMDTVLDCLDWVLETPRSIIGGRNISVVFDHWGNDALARQLAIDTDMYTLRRSGNAWQLPSKTRENDDHEQT